MTEERAPSRELRRRFEQEYALPLARAMFELEPRCQSVLVTIGQYWCDEATDAVHCELLACAERDPSWPESAQARPGAIGDPETLALLMKEAEDPTYGGPADLHTAQWTLHDQASIQAFGKRYFTVLDDNSDMIVAFASYCREVSDQEQPRWRSHTPYGVIRRPATGEPAVFEVTGAMHRPQWEDRWDVLQNDGLITGTGDGPLEANETSAPSADGLPPGSPPSPGSRAAILSPTYRVLLFLLVILAIIAVRGCLA
ncbi:MAG TPA: hypothetical protein VHP33_38265 [Polyangiaceae bacterium]|nr:hypothetical protein [Polyangiaceae bacterium]